MRAIVVTLFVAIASAAPQYNYQLPSSIGLSKSINNQNPEAQSLLRDVLQNQQLSQAILGPNPAASQQASYSSYRQQQQFAPQIQYQRQEPQLLQQQQQFNYQTAPLPPLVTKDIYVHAAPEEPEDNFLAARQAALPPRKLYRIVFIKAPTQRVSPAALRLVQAPTEEKTIIYVLSKKQDPLELQTILQNAAPKPPAKPEVYFIKYKTPEEAAHAQRTIQAQYDSLGGTSSISDEGIAPVTSVIGSLQAQQPIGIPVSTQESSGLSTAGSNVSASETSSNAYLPPTH